ncbi:hypothetical protein M514_02194 [Trichuris suis]|uniref:Uncharacterized protein n=1 Tax=Trichuris suis TaxID=68888 RepID=A0A085MI91_9BILA|nr:hypothetical protein M513_02194 [Trichuris suis]KFD66182.1 hypothetical protein M514_02194 [Trichuris suis]
MEQQFWEATSGDTDPQGEPCCNHDPVLDSDDLGAVVEAQRVHPLHLNVGIRRRQFSCCSPGPQWQHQESADVGLSELYDDQKSRHSVCLL